MATIRIPCKICGDPPGGDHDMTRVECAAKSGMPCGAPERHHPYERDDASLEAVALDLARELDSINGVGYDTWPVVDAVLARARKLGLLP